jgi:tetratricopeptide (TPR) repeat protein
MLLSVAGTVVVLAIAILIWRNYQQSQEAKAQKQFGDALEIFHGLATSGTAKAPDAQANPSFASEPEKYRKAQQQFDQIYQHHGASKVGRLAHYYSALSHAYLKNDKEAIRILQEEEKNPDPEARGLVRNALAELYRSSGMNEQAMQVYQAMLKDNESKFPRDAILAGMAQTAETMGKTSEAAGYYQRLTREHAQSVYGNDARARLAALNSPK